LPDAIPAIARLTGVVHNGRDMPLIRSVGNGVAWDEMAMTCRGTSKQHLPSRIGIARQGTRSGHVPD